MKVSDNCGFRYTFHKSCLCTHNLLRALISFSMRPISLTPFQWSISGLDITKTTRLRELCHGNVIRLHSLSFQQLKHMVPYSFGLFRIDFWNTKVPKIITLYYKNMCRFSRMHTLETFLSIAHATLLIPLLFFSRWISILITRDILLNFEDKNFFSSCSRINITTNKQNVIRMYKI